ESRFGNHPGNTNHFDLPVTRQQARELLQDFIEHRLQKFGAYQDAMWQGEPFLYHSRISAAMNIKLISPRELVEQVVKVYKQENMPLNSVEGFIRQVLGWREFMRGIYWNEMPEYLDNNFFNAEKEVPPFYWHGKTKMACVEDAMQSVLNYGYAHHIQRLMVLGLFAQLYGVHPAKFHDWHMAMYNDAIDWVSLPNAFGMSQFGDGGLVATKPYTASANYINKMGNYCQSCRYNHRKVTEEDACPFNALYWDFLQRNRNKLADNRRMLLQMRNLEKKTPEQLESIQQRSKFIKENIEEI
ncbi:MAG: cryptochrome/photolyase family protein, partial [Cyclobacteriaceae bacterium]